MANTLTVSVPGYTDVTGHTEYIIKSSVGEQQFAVQHRFSNFLELHEAMLSKLSKLPAAFPISKSMFGGESVKRERVEKLQEYLRRCLTLSGDRPPAALLKFLRVDASTFYPTGGPSEGADASGSCETAFSSFSPFGGPNAAFVPERPDDVNEALREGIKAGDTPLCLELIKSKADPQFRDRQGNTPLHMASLFNRTDVAKALLLAGADLTLQNGAGELPERMATVSMKMKFTKFKETGDI